MEINELYLKTAFCCMACDGDIADDEVQYIANFATENAIDKVMDVEEKLNVYVSEINRLKQAFLNTFIKELSETKLSKEEELKLAKTAVDMILSDQEIEYSEIKFFKRIRSKLRVSDDEIMAVLPEDKENPNMPKKEDFLEPDICVPEEELWDINFEEIKLGFDIKC